jgi:hypothetical protein
MRVFLDNNVPAGVARIISHHAVSTSPQLGWTKVQNGDLLAAAEAGGFEVMVTADQNIKYQQDLTKRTIALVVLGSNIWPLVNDQAAMIVAAVDAAQPGSFEFIEMPLPPKKRT